MELLHLLYSSEEEADGSGLAATGAVERALGRAGIPPKLWTPLVDDVRRHADQATVSSGITAVVGAVDAYLASLQIRSAR